jgi:hypothetical protein
LGGRPRFFGGAAGFFGAAAGGASVRRRFSGGGFETTASPRFWRILDLRDGSA